jgi:hypothetical protein
MLTYLPSEFGSKAGSPAATPYKGGAYPVTKGIENYDVRVDKSDEAARAIQQIKSGANRTASQLAGKRQQLLNGEAELRRQIPALQVEYSSDLRAPEMIGVDVRQRAFLTAPSGIGPNRKRAEQVRAFLARNDDLFGLDHAQISQLVVRADYTNPDGRLSFVDLGQEINGIPVFRGEVRAMITPKGEIARLISNLAPGLEYGSLATTRGRAEDAIFAAARYINRTATSEDVQLRSTEQNGNVKTFYTGQFADPSRAELMYFPLEPGVATLAWRVTLVEPANAYYVMVDAQTGALLWRKNTTADQTQTATYGIYNDDNPGPLSPSNAIPGSGIQGPGIARSIITLIGNEAPNPGMNNLGWITDGSNVTDGNNVEAGPDLVPPNGVDAPATGNPNRVFNFAYNPPPLGSDGPPAVNYFNGVTTNVFYWVNLFHDRLYAAGFTEPARNFQHDNFGRGGVGGDRISAEVGDLNVNFSVQADGARGRLQLSTFPGATPPRDTALEAAAFIHELTHGLSGRLVGNGSGLSNNRGASMAEGWGDFYSRLLLSTADEDVNGVYPMAPYVSFGFSSVGTDNYYYGIRRFPYATKAATGGPMNRPHNPLTLADIDPAQINVADGAYPAMAGPHISTQADQVHVAGEVWCALLTEVRARIIARLGFVAGNQRMLQITTDSMKLMQLNPNFIQARDAILVADIAGFGGADTNDIWAGFASRGAGFRAQDGLALSGVVQSFDLPNAEVVDPFSVDDSPGNNNGYPEPSEPVLLNVTVANHTGGTLHNVTIGAVSGGSVNVGTLANGSMIAQAVPYTVPAVPPCGSPLTVTLNVSSTEVPGVNSYIRTFRVGVPIGGTPVAFSNNTAIDIPAGQPATTSGPAGPYPSTINVSGLSGPKAMRVTFNGFHHEFEDDVDMLLVGPGGQKMVIMSDNGGNTELLTPITFSLADSAGALLPDASGLVDQAEYRPSNVGTTDDVFPSPAPATPYQQPQPAGTATFASVFGTNGASLNGTWSLYILDDAGSDPGRIDGGWKLSFEQDVFVCPYEPPGAAERADFDGDGKSDVSVVRDGGTWYLNRSTAGFTGVSFGASGDVAVPGDYDGDGKTDEAVVRGGTTWYLLRSTAGFIGLVFGAAGDVPVPADYDGDLKADVAVYRPSANAFFVLRSSDGAVATTPWGTAGDIPLIGDFDGDGKCDYTVFRPGTGAWYTLKSTGGVAAATWGLAGDRLVPGDYDGDHSDDYAVFRASNWYILKSTGGMQSIGWGLAGDTPVPGDFDGDGKFDAAVFRGGNWYLLNSTTGPAALGFGLASDVPVPARYVP